MIAPLSIRVAADTPLLLFYLFANVDKRILPSPNINRLDQEKYTFTRLLLHSLVLQPGFLLDCLLAVFVDGLQMIPFPTPPAIHATWLWLLPRWDSHPLEGSCQAKCRCLTIELTDAAAVSPHPVE